ERRPDRMELERGADDRVVDLVDRQHALEARVLEEVVVGARAVDPDVDVLVDRGGGEGTAVAGVMRRAVGDAPAGRHRAGGDVVDWCKEGLERAGIAGEVLIVDSSRDRTSEIALARGARVLKTPKRVLGRAYIDALPFVRGRYILMGDADCTYDFRLLAPFVE